MSHRHSVFGIDTESSPGRHIDTTASFHADGTVGAGTCHSHLGTNRIGHYNLNPKRLTIVLAIIFVTFFLFFSKAVFLQLVEGASYRTLAEGNRVRTQVITPPRGIIYDRTGVILAENEPTFTLTMTIADLPRDTTERSTLFNRIADQSGIVRTDLDLFVTKHAATPYDAIPIKKGIPYESAIRLSIETADIDGFSLETGLARAYHPSAPSLSHVLGYVGTISSEEYTAQNALYRPTDSIGKTGVEKSAEHLLRGHPGTLTTEVNAGGNELAVISKEAPVPGANITLALDLELQSFIERTLQSTLRDIGQFRGSVVAIDPNTGGVRAMVSLPTFDNNAFSHGIDQDVYQSLISDPNNPLFHRAVAGEFPSGSTFKPFVAYAALDEGIISEHTSFVSQGGIGVGPWFFPDWKAGGHGITNVRKAIAESVNTFFYIIGGGFDRTSGLGVARISEYAKAFGFGTQTGIDLPGEADGFLPTKAWKQEAKGERWYVGDTYHLAIGQGDFLTTPLQMAHATAIIANGGTNIQPHMIEAVDGGEGVQLSPTYSGPIDNLNERALQIVREGMRQTVTRGSARRLNALPIEIAAKTGTAQAPGGQENHAWTTAFAPYKRPELALAVLVEEGKESAIAVGVVEQIFAWWSARQ